MEQVYQEARKVFVKSEPLNHPNITFVLGEFPHKLSNARSIRP